jgi:hypothetical protein
MTALVYEVDFFDSANQGAPATTLTPVFSVFKRLPDLVDLSGQAPAITNAGNGKYVFSWDPTVNEVTWQVDGGASLVIGSDRYINSMCLKDNTADGLAAIALAVWNTLVATIQGGSGVAGSIGRLLGQFSFSAKNALLRVSPGGYEDTQSPIDLFRAAPLTINPVTGTWDECMSVMRALAAGKQVEDLTFNIMSVYAHDNQTVLYQLTFTPNLSTPTSRTSNR